MAKYTILLVDDDVNVLRSLKRLFGRDGEIDTVLAENAQEGVSVLKSQHIDLLISDQRMPHIEGHKFIEFVKKYYPDVIRIILTGYADTEAMLAAVNRGEVYRYLYKPWEDNELMVTVKNALKHAKAEQEREKLTEELKALNRSLEEKVEKRTVELEKALSIIREERNRTRRRLHGTAQFLDSIRGLIDKETRGDNTSKQIRDIVIRLGGFSEIPDEVMQVSILAAYFYRIGTVADTHAKATDKLDPELLEKSEQLISGVLQYPELEKAIRHIGENYDGSGGPEGIGGEEIPLASRVLRIVHDYTHIIMERKLSEKEAAGLIVQHKGTLYDPIIAAHLFSMYTSEPEKESLQDEYKKVKVTELQSGMRLADDLYLDNGIFYLAADTRITEEIKKRIKNCALDNSFPLSKERTIGVTE